MNDTQHVLILGGGTGGTITANRLRRTLPASVDISVIDGSEGHVYQPGLLFVPFGLADADELVRPLDQQLHRGVAYIRDTVDCVDTSRKQVRLASGRSAAYDVLVIATGARLLPEETEGLDGPDGGRTSSRSTRSTERAHSRPRSPSSRPAGSS